MLWNSLVTFLLLCLKNVGVDEQRQNAAFFDLYFSANIFSVKIT